MSTPRLRSAERCQVQMRCESLDQLLPPEHPARAVWQFVLGLDWPLEATVRATAHRRGSGVRPAVAAGVVVVRHHGRRGVGPRVVRVVSDPLGVPLAERRVGDQLPHTGRLPHGPAGVPRRAVDDLGGSALQAGVVELNRVAQDGLKVRRRRVSRRFAGRSGWPSSWPWPGSRSRRWPSRPTKMPGPPRGGSRRRGCAGGGSAGAD